MTLSRGYAIAFTALLCATAAPARASCRAEGNDARPHLVELYTSEGCSSCPPAEKWLSSLRGKPAWIALEYHVDYWDTDDFHDPYADAKHTARQKAFARARKVNVVTPQIAIDGQAWTNWPKGAPPEPVQAPAPALAMSASRDDARVRVHVEIAGAPDEQVFLALTEDGLSNPVRAGENRGKRLAHDHVVRAFAGPFPAVSFDAELAMPRDAVPANARIVAFVQNAGDGRVLQAVPLPLASCPS